MKLQILLISGGCIALLAFAPLVHADPAKAEDDCYSMAVHYTARGFAMSPTNTSGVATAGFIVKVMIPITKGLDYVILVGRDKFARDVDLYVYDEDGQLILDDRRTDTRAGVKFRASYTGTCEAFVHMARAQGLAAYALLVGRRGIETPTGAEPRSLGWEPTFQMGGASPPPGPQAPVGTPPTRPPRP